MALRAVLARSYWLAWAQGSNSILLVGYKLFLEIMVGKGITRGAWLSYLKVNKVVFSFSL
jgi:hypothetical protein